MVRDGQELILIVEDERSVREILCQWLTRQGYECLTAAGGEEAIAILQTHEVSLLLVDIVMPGMSGVELLRVVKERFPATAAIVVTGLDDRDTAIKTLELGAYGYVMKPFRGDEVLISVTQALERRRLVQKSQAYEHQLEEDALERTADIRRREEEIALRLVAASEYRDEETGAHIRRIGLYMTVLAERFGWSGKDVEDLRVAAPMHDVGKIGVPDHILLKPAKLTDDEFEVVKQHTVIGAGILDGSDVPLLSMAKDIALSHHERWDGSGYPAGLAGEAIPASARMVAVADVYDALVHRRVYRDAVPEDEAIAHMEQDKGFDPKVFDCFVHVLPEFRRIRQEVSDRYDQGKRARSAAQAKPLPTTGRRQVPTAAPIESA